MRATSIWAAIAAAVVIAACGGGDDKAGGAGGVTTLEVGTPDRPDRPSSNALKRIATEVERRSKGRLRLRIVHESQTRVGARNAADADQVVARQVRAGDLDLGMVPSRAFDDLGVTSLQALQTPFLITTDRLLGQVVGGDLGERMLPGVAKAGVVGLGLHAEGLRHPIGYSGRPLVRLADFAGKEIEVRRSRASYALIRALGAEPVWYADDAEFEQALAERRVVGVDGSYALSGTFGVDRPVVTGNVTFFPKVNVLVANEKALDALSGEHEELLRAAAAAERERSVDALDERAAALGSCKRGAGSVHAAPADVEAIRQAARPVVDALRADAQTAALIDAIGRLDSAPADLPPACEGTPVAGRETAVLRGPTGKLPLGTYRLRVTDEELRSRGVGPGDIEVNAGLFTIALKKDGTWAMNQRPAHYVDTPTDYGGDFSVDGDRLTTTVTHGIDEARGFRDVYRWSLRGDELTLRPLKLHAADNLWHQLGGAWLAGVPWRRIG
jgi:TRAP-type C4-dicarboxylate transport system substrate-binding protein